MSPFFKIDYRHRGCDENFTKAELAAMPNTIVAFGGVVVEDLKKLTSIRIISKTRYNDIKRLNVFISNFYNPNLERSRRLGNKMQSYIECVLSTIYKTDMGLTQITDAAVDECAFPKVTINPHMSDIEVSAYVLETFKKYANNIHKIATDDNLGDIDALEKATGTLIELYLFIRMLTGTWSSQPFNAYYHVEVMRKLYVNVVCAAVTVIDDLKFDSEYAPLKCVKLFNTIRHMFYTDGVERTIETYRPAYLQYTTSRELYDRIERNFEIADAAYETITKTFADTRGKAFDLSQIKKSLHGSAETLLTALSDAYYTADLMWSNED